MEPRSLSKSLFADPQQSSLIDLLDSVLNAGVVIHGEVVLTVAGVDLVFLGLHALIASTETMLRARDSTARALP